MVRKIISLLFPLTVALFLGACSSLSGLIPFFGPPTTSLKAVRIQSMPESNRNQPTRLDLVFVYEQGMALPKSGPEWFRQKDALLAAHQQKLDAVSFELPPITEVASVALPGGFGKALAVLVYADYQSPAGQNMADLTNFRKPLIRLEAESFAIVEQP